MIAERLSTGLAAAALGTLVFVMVLLAGWYGLSRLPGGLFGSPVIDPDSPVIVFDGAVGNPSGGARPASPPVPPAVPAPALSAPSDPPPAAAPAPGTDPDPAPVPAVPPRGPGAGPPPSGALDETVESVVRLTASTVTSLGSTVGDTLGVLLGLLGSQPPDVKAASVDEEVTSGGGPHRAPMSTAAVHDDTPTRRKVPKLPR